MLKTVGSLSSRTGNQTIIDGNLVIGTSGKGIDFSGTPGTGTSELLNDYEEGTWTPVISGTTTAGTYEINSASATYTKVGRLVTLNAYIPLASSITGGGSGLLQITGLPFAKMANSSAFGVIAYSGVGYTSASVNNCYFGTTASASRLLIWESASNAAVNVLGIAAISASDVIALSISYEV